jgi:hypothetical protein
MEHIIDAMGQQRGGRLELVAERGMGAGRSVADADDVAVPDEDRGLAIDDLARVQRGGAATTNSWSP